MVTKTKLLLLIIICMPYTRSIFGIDDGDRQGCTAWDIAKNPYTVMIVGFIAQKFIPPLIEYTSNSCDNLYNAYWLTPEQRNQLQKQEQQKNEALLEQYQKAEMRYKILLTSTEQGQQIVLKKEEQNIRLNETHLIENELILAAATRENFLRDIEAIDKLIEKESDPQIVAYLQKNRLDKMQSWLHMKK